MKNKIKFKHDKGPPSYENWKLKKQNTELQYLFEIPFYSDASIIGECTYGPYIFLNAFADPRKSDQFKIGCVLRVENFLGRTIKIDYEMEKTDDSIYHGGELQDEIAALTSLLLGARIVTGEKTREFEKNGDPYGRPIHYQIKELPILIKKDRDLIIPQVRKNKNLARLASLETYLLLTPEEATVLIKSARLYQDALLITEWQPEIAWLLFVSAIENAAQFWRKKSESAIDRFQTSMPDLYEYLLKFENDELIKTVATKFVEYTGLTRKFIDFLLMFLPPKMGDRPEDESLSWESEELEIVFKKIYDYRSKSLHVGGRFPGPMCWKPYIKNGKIYETPLGLQMWEKGGTWNKDDVPIVIHTFEYIVRNALINWWGSLIEK